MAPRPIPACMHGRCCRCLVRGHRAAECRDPFRCSRCLENGHRARGCRNPWRVVHRHATASCEGPMKSTLPSKAFRHRSWASVISATGGSATQPDVQSALADQIAQLQGWMTRVESFLERAEAVLDKLSLGPTMLSTSLLSCPPGVAGVATTEEGSQELYGCFSPRAGDNTPSLSTFSLVLPTIEGEPSAVLKSSVLQIMPDLQELCLSPVLPLSVERLEVDSLVTWCEGHVSPLSHEQVEVPEAIVSVVPMGDVVVSVVSMADDVETDDMLAPDPLEPSQSLAFVDGGGSDVPVTNSHVTVGHVMSVRDKVDEILFELEIHSLLKRLEAASPGSGKAIVEEALRNQRKKSGATGKASAAA
ncbi:hypothetical protein VPH35_026889 [Triticum aestivum]